VPRQPTHSCRFMMPLQMAVAVVALFMASAASAAPYIHDARITVVDAVDADLNGYFEVFELGVTVDAHAGALVSYDVAAIIRCTSTGNEFFTQAWSGFGNDNNPQTFYFSETDFYLLESVNLVFEIELWNSDFSTFHELLPHSYIPGGPVPAEGIGGATATIRSAEIVRFSGTDSDANGYYEAFSFDVNVEADTLDGVSLEVAAIVTCTGTGDFWLLASWTITGDAPDACDLHLTHADFNLDAPAMPAFVVALYNPDLTIKYHEAAVAGSFGAEPPAPSVALASSAIQDLRKRTDADSDGYFEECEFDIAIDADTTSGERLITADVACTQTGQQWRSPPFAAAPGSDDTMLMTFSHEDFNLFGPTALGFTISLWDASHTLQLTQEQPVAGGMVELEPTGCTDWLSIQATVRYKDQNGAARPVRWALVDIYENNMQKTQTCTNAEGHLERTLRVYNPANYRLRVYTSCVEGSHPAASTDVAEVRESPAAAAYYVDSSTIHNEGSSVHFDILIDNTGPNAGAFAVFDSIMEGYHKAVTWLGVYSLPKVNVYWPDDHSYYDGAAIRLLELDRWDRDVIMHEYGHFIADRLGFLGSEGGEHDWDSDCRVYGGPRTDSDAARLAFAEGWATFYSVASQFAETADPCYNDTEDFVTSVNLETDTARHYAPGQYFESMIACAWWDMFDDNDSPVDNDDRLCLGIQPIWSILSGGKPKTIEAFWDHWLDTDSCKVQVDRILRDHRMTFLPTACKIQITSDVPSAPFELVEQHSQPIAGTTPAAWQPISPGSYTITWLDSGGITPPPQTQTLRPGQTATFHGQYLPADPDPPAPNAFASAQAIGTDRISITSQAAADATPPVEYRIVGEAFNGLSWQEGFMGVDNYEWSSVRPNNWIDSGLHENTLYRYNQYVRDSSTHRNVSEPATVCVATLLGPPHDDEVTFSQVSETSIRVAVAAPPQGSGPGQTAADFDIITGQGQGENANDTGWITSFEVLFGGLLPNTQYGWRVRYQGHSGYETAFNPNEQKVTTLAATPAVPQVTCATAATVSLRPDPGGNPEHTQLAVICLSSQPHDEHFDQAYVGGNGRPSAEPVWLTSAEWGEAIAGPLQPLGTYRFAAMARNADGLHTASGPAVEARASVQGDVNGDCKVNILDLLAIRMHLGRDLSSSPPALAADLNNDGRVNILDLLVCRMHLGAVCP